LFYPQAYQHLHHPQQTELELAGKQLVLKTVKSAVKLPSALGSDAVMQVHRCALFCIITQTMTEVDPDVLLYDCKSLMVCAAQSFRIPFFTVCGHVTSFNYVNIISSVI